MKPYTYVRYGRSFTIQIPDNYRPLRPLELIRCDDIFWHSGAKEFMPAQGMRGCIWQHGSIPVFRPGMTAWQEIIAAWRPLIKKVKCLS